MRSVVENLKERFQANSLSLYELFIVYHLFRWILKCHFYIQMPWNICVSELVVTATTQYKFSPMEVHLQRWRNNEFLGERLLPKRGCLVMRPVWHCRDPSLFDWGGNHSLLTVRGTAYTAVEYNVRYAHFFGKATEFMGNVSASIPVYKKQDHTLRGGPGARWPFSLRR